VSADRESEESRIFAPPTHLAETLPFFGSHLSISLLFSFRERPVASAPTVQGIPGQPLLLHYKREDCGDSGLVAIQRRYLPAFQGPKVLANVARAEVLERNPSHSFLPPTELTFTVDDVGRSEGGKLVSPIVLDDFGDCSAAAKDAVTAHLALGPRSPGLRVR